MASTFPTTLDNFNNPSASDSMTAAGVVHHTQHSDENDAIENMQAKIGVDGSAVTTTLDYKLKSASSTDPGHKHTESALTLADNTTDDVSSTKHGFAPKSPADATKFLNGAATPAYAQVKDSDLSSTDITTNDVSSTKHGFAPKSAADATKFLNGAATPAYAQVKDSDLATTDVTTNDVSSAKHGFSPKSPGDATKFLNGAATPAFATPLLLSSTASVDLNTATATLLYTVPTGKTCVVLHVIVRNASTSLTTASYSFGWNSTSYNDVIADATHTELTGSTLYTMLNPKAGAAVGASTGTLYVKPNTLQGGAATVTISVFGYLF